MMIHIFRRHICLATLSNTFGHAFRIIAMIDQRIAREYVKPFVQEIEVYVGEGKGLSEKIGKIEGQGQLCTTYQGTLCFRP